MDAENLTYFNLSCLEKVENCSHSTIYEVSYIPPLWQQFCWGIIFGLMVIVATIGNAIVIWIILAHRKMRTVTNYFLLNLSITDLLIATFNVVFNFIYMLRSHWPFGMTYCVISNFIANLSVSTSVFTMSAMSVDRFFAVVRPLKPRPQKRRILIVIVIIWSSGILLSSPTLIYSTTETYILPTGTRTLCFLIWPDGYSSLSITDYVYNIIFLFVTYVVPMIFMIVTYTWMGQNLWGNKGIGELTVPQLEAVKSKQRVVKMFIVVVLLFAVCWLPYHVYFLYAYHHKDFQYTPYVQPIYLSIYWLAMSNSMYNPIVYYWMNKRFRNYFRVVLCFCKKEKGLGKKHQSSENTTKTLFNGQKSNVDLSNRYKSRKIRNDDNCNNVGTFTKI
ncbi:tachykinin-like peptides receptor 86C isoform X1 [Centruroides sculpturatus]|uniref:tachykinin-like peptides receptor 86C isoform X1 n=1 Tax=Centruroides sculpturatus TaxID=218467 RepID=UPI000C6ED34B|nr:tachykinin-like peptides receptor 86C isoform X1 [Centruroides sculpturatus]